MVSLKKLTVCGVLALLSGVAIWQSPVPNILSNSLEMRRFAEAQIQPRGTLLGVSGGAPVAQIRAERKPQKTLSIALIGDSWVANQALDKALTATFEADDTQPKLNSFGQPGAVSKRIYQNLYAPPSANYSSRAVLTSTTAYDYVVIVAGVNDSANYLGADFYRHHMGLMVDALKAKGSLPVIVELPEYGIETLFSEQPPRGKWRRAVFRHLFNEGEINVIARYRQALVNELAKNHPPEDYLLVSFDLISRDFQRDQHLYQDAAHLNERGKNALARAIHDAIQDHQQWLKL